MSHSCDPTDCSPPGSSVCGILQAGILEWVVIFFSRGSSHGTGPETSWGKATVLGLWAAGRMGLCLPQGHQSSGHVRHRSGGTEARLGRACLGPTPVGKRASPEHTEADALLGLPSPVVPPALCFHGPSWVCPYWTWVKELCGDAFTRGRSFSPTRA